MKVEVKDIDTSPPSPACKITGTVTTGDLMADMVNLKACAEAVMMASSAAAAVMEAVRVNVAATPMRRRV